MFLALRSITFVSENSRLRILELIIGRVDTRHTQYCGGDKTKIVMGSDCLVEGFYSAHSYFPISFAILQTPPLSLIFSEAGPFRMVLKLPSLVSLRGLWLFSKLQTARGDSKLHAEYDISSWPIILLKDREFKILSLYWNKHIYTVDRK